MSHHPGSSHPTASTNATLEDADTPATEDSAEVLEVPEVASPQVPSGIAVDNNTDGEDTPKKISNVHPSRMPYVNDTYTFTKRKRELAMLISLLDEKRESLLEELGYVNHCIANNDYPNIQVLDPTSEE